MKDKLRAITNKNNGWGNDYRRQKLTEFVRGWINYFSMADMKALMEKIDEWLRRRIRTVYWRQWKKVKTRYRMLKALKLPEWKVHELANCRKGYWRAAQVLNCALTNKIIARLGYISMSDYYLKICEN
ncbi:MAG: group II intron maturase-specific domain-containing protein [Anaerocolumna sp.]